MGPPLKTSHVEKPGKGPTDFKKGPLARKPRTKGWLLGIKHTFNCQSHLFVLGYL